MRKHGLPAPAVAALVAAAAVAAAPNAGAQELPPPALVLGDGRYAVTATFQAPGASESPAFPAPLTRDTGYFPDALIRPSELTPFLCAVAQGEVIHYLSQQGSGEQRGFSHWTTRPGGAPQPAGTWAPATPQPEPPWFPLFEQCVELYVAPCCALS